MSARRRGLVAPDAGLICEDQTERVESREALKWVIETDKDIRPVAAIGHVNTGRHVRACK